MKNLTYNAYVATMAQFLCTEYRFDDYPEALAICEQDLNDWLSEENICFGDEGYSFTAADAEEQVNTMVSYWD